MTSSFRRTLATVAATTTFGLALLLNGVSNAPSANAQAQTMGEGNAYVRVIHASPDAPAVDVYVDGSKAISDLAFGKASSWATLPAGTHSVKVTAAGQQAPVVQADLALEAGKYYSVAAVGKLAEIKPALFIDDLSPLAGKARLRVVHASPDAPAVDVAARGGPVLVPNLSFPNASDYLTVDPMTVDVEVRPAGTTNVALAVPGVSLEAGKVYSVYAIGLLNGGPALTVLPLVDEAAAGQAPLPSAAGMPATGAGHNTESSLLALALLAAIIAAGGWLVRARAEQSRSR